MKPYTDIEVTDEYIIREFDENIDPIELMWHRDDENRLVEALEPTDWKIQLDNKLPMPLNINESIYVPKNVYHRLIKGRSTENLVVEVTEYAEGWGAQSD